MTVAAGQFPLIGSQPVTNSTGIGVEVATATSGYVPQVPLGTIVNVYDPFYGGLELIRLSVATSTTCRVGNMSTIPNTFAYTPLPNTANMGQPFAVSYSDVPSNASFVQYAWFVIAGRYPINSTANVAADTAIGIGASAQGGAVSAGRQLVNCRVFAPSTFTIAKTGNTRSGSPIITVPNTDGWFVGGALSGTGIPASTSIGSISADGTQVSMVQTGTTTAQNATATGSVTITQTNNDGTRYWNTCTFNRPFAQGQIT